MACELCGRNSCTRCFHSLGDQEDFDNKTGKYAPPEPDAPKEATVSETFTTYGIGPSQPTYEQLRDENARLREVIEVLANGTETHKDWSALHKKYLADDDWWARKGNTEFYCWVARRSLQQTGGVE